MDAILADEPVLPAPSGVATAVMARVATRRRQEALWLRAQVLIWAAAAVLVGAIGLALANPLLGQIEAQGQALAQESEVSLGLLESARELLFDVSVTLDASVSSTLSAAAVPSPPWMLLLLTLPVLLMNWSIARGGRPKAVTT